MVIYVTNSASTPNSSQISQNISIAGGSPVVPGTAYNLSFWVNGIANGPSYVENYGVGWLDNKGIQTNFTGWIGFNSTPGTWTQITATNLVAPPTAVNAVVQIYGVTGAVSNGYGGVAVDDVSLTYNGQNRSTNVISVIAQPAIQIAWPSVGGKNYDVRWSGNLAGSVWSNLVSSAPGNGITNTVSDVIAPNGSRFYRVVELP
jgi:hypothetical protein